MGHYWAQLQVFLLHTNDTVTCTTKSKLYYSVKKTIPLCDSGRSTIIVHEYFDGEDGGVFSKKTLNSVPLRSV